MAAVYAMDTDFKSSDNVLKQLGAERRKQVESLQRRQAEQLKELETRGQRQLSTLTASLGKDNAELFQRLEKVHAEEVRKSQVNVLDVRTHFSTNGSSLVATREHPRIDISGHGFQYNWKPQAGTNVFDIDSQNINVNDRFDGWRTMYYSDLLGGGDAAYVLVSAAFYVYARGGGSHAELNFSDGAANSIGVPWVYIS